MRFRAAAGAFSLAAGLTVGGPLVANGVGGPDETTGATTAAPPPPTVPRAEYERMRRLARHRLLGWRRAARQRNRLRVLWRPTVFYALRLGAAVSGVSYGAMQRVAWCESRLDPSASNGRYRGLFQLGWAPFGLSPYDPVANAISAGLTVRHDGGWRQWECKP